ncbi:MAG: hypothetical protein KAR38_13080, partial [Calditrichia bacterium]|nr:hypothetical protein [Calditrichia bacterium]
FENSNYQYYYKIILDILKDFIFICSQYNKIIIVFENLQFYTKETKDWLFQLIKGINHPILTIFTTNNIPANILPEIQILKLEPLNVKSVEKLIQHNLKSGEINAKFITNFVHIKSNGNPAYIINLINEIFKDETLYADDILDVNKVNPKELPSNWQEFWEYKWNNLENKENLEKVFYYLLLFPHEKNFTFWKGLFRTLKLVDEFKTLIEKKWLTLEKNMNEKWVYPYNSTLLDFIKLKISNEKIMSFVAKHKNKTLTDKIIPQLSYNSMLLDTFSLTAYQLTKIFEEIKKLIAYGRFQHAINIINTLVLSPEFEDLSKNNRIKILKLLAELFEYQGNYENAILYFQRLKDLIKPSEKELRSEINYHIGKNLFKIDKIQEANILLKRVVEKDAPSSILKAK